MFGFLTYPHKVTKRLFELGWSPQTLPEISNAWLQMLHGLRKNGIDARRAGNWIDKALQGDIDYLQKINDNSGVFGMMFWGVRKNWDERGPVIFRK